MRALLPLLIVALTGCDGSLTPLATGPAFSDRGSAFDCPASAGAPRIELCDGSSEHRPVDDGVTLPVRRMPQGFTVIMTPVWFGGLPGGEVLDVLDLSFTSDDGERIGNRNNRNWMLPCDDLDNVAADWMDTILPAGTQPGEFDRVSGLLTFTATRADGTDLTDEVTAVLDHPAND